jgi:hypothetical protein
MRTRNLVKFLDTAANPPIEYLETLLDGVGWLIPHQARPEATLRTKNLTADWESATQAGGQVRLQRPAGVATRRYPLTPTPPTLISPNPSVYRRSVPTF